MRDGIDVGRDMFANDLDGRCQRSSCYREGQEQSWEIYSGRMQFCKADEVRVIQTN